VYTGLKEAQKFGKKHIYKSGEVDFQTSLRLFEILPEPAKRFKLERFGVAF